MNHDHWLPQSVTKRILRVVVVSSAHFSKLLMRMKGGERGLQVSIGIRASLQETRQGRVTGELFTKDCA